MQGVSGNADAVRLLRAALARAEEGDIGAAAVIILRANPGKVAFEFAGAVNFHEPAERACDALKAKIGEQRRRFEPPIPDPALGADYVCYDAANASLSYDAIPWLVDAEMTRRREGAPAPLKVAFWFGQDGQCGLNLPGRRQMFENVVRPALALVGAVEDPRAIRGRRTDVYTTREIVAAARRGETVPLLLADGPCRFPGAVTITLREADHWPHRNSNLKAWLRFALWLRGRGETVVFVRDTQWADLPLDDFPIYPEASTNLRVRAALYAAAKANLFVSNGPAILAIFGARPWLQFIDLKPDGHLYHADTPSFFRDHMGVEPGGQYRWSRPDQRIVYAPDTYENLVAAWEALAPQIEQAA